MEECKCICHFDSGIKIYKDYLIDRYSKDAENNRPQQRKEKIYT